MKRPPFLPCLLMPCLLVLTLLGGIASTAAAQAVVEGRVTAQGRPVPFANVGVRGTAYGTASDLEGRFRIEQLPAGTYTFVASAVGFSAAEQVVSVAAGETATVTFELEETVVETEGVVVTGTLIETYVKDSPVKVDVVSPRYLEKIPTANVMEVLENVNGLSQQIDCAVCGTNNIRINGMDGPYTAVLIDGMPIMSSLATVYGLNGISPALIQQVEIIKGPMSTLYGSEAMGGVINIITKNPQTAPRFAVNAFGTTDAEYAADVGVVPTRGRLATLLSGTLFYNNRFLDGNGDDFADLTLNTRASLFAKAALTDARGLKQLDLSARYYYEDRLGGTEAFVDHFSDALRGSDEVYGETIRTHRVEVAGSYHLRPEQGLRLDFAFNDHDQDSYYGAASYQARQTTGFAQLLWPLRLGGRQSLLIGAAARVQRYDDNTGSTGVFDDDGHEIENRPDDRLIPGVFAQHELVPNEQVRLLSGLRLDYQQDHGVIAAPRLSLKLQPEERTTLRLSGGTGFRIVNLFTEDHAAYTGARATVLLEDLDPERSYSATASLQYLLPFGANPLTIDLEGFYTYFTNKIEPNYDTPGIILYENLDGSATTRGLSLTLSQSLTTLPLTYTVGGTLMDVFVEADGARKPLEFAPDFQAVANATYRLPYGFAVDYTMNLTGPMKLPEYAPPFERPAVSPTFSIHNVQVTKDLDVPNGTRAQAYLAIENLFDYTQPAPLVDPANPFGPHFDTAYVYGPIHGRCIGLGARLTLPR
jgi:outer membrane receptor for ferrienterochelin and colicins